MGGGAEAGQVPDKLRYFMWNNQTSDPAGHPDYKYTLQRLLTEVMTPP